MIVEDKKENLNLRASGITSREPMRSRKQRAAGFMTERLLQFIWQFQYFNTSELKTAAGEDLQIIFPGTYNANQGPDFADAKIRIGKTTWAGSVELHIRASDWNRHNHQVDKNYNNVVLHVVWENDFPNYNIPVLNLENRIAGSLLQRYEELMNAQGFIACERSISSVRHIILQSWKERLLAERLTRKSLIVHELLEQNNQHWEETFWWLLARNFGVKINAESFESMARSIPVSILAKHKNQIHQLEALLMGQANLLGHRFSDDYAILLQREYEFYKTKYKLRPGAMTPFFLRMRPGNFPTIRLAQLAMLIHNSEHLFSKITETDSVKDVKNWLNITANDYWHYHYRFDEPSSFKRKRLGSAMIDNIVINTVCPVLFAYGHFHKEQKYTDRAIRWLEEVRAESNSITKGFQQLGVENKNARDSQALIELKNQYCTKKKCLDCAIGNALLKS
ncbi:MAG TPA: DUF2851 family protein [Chitinophagaceae bacterium]|nr:DUF2851 family protein [Chitinophagaceae bacterium]